MPEILLDGESASLDSCDGIKVPLLTKSWVAIPVSRTAGRDGGAFDGRGDAAPASSLPYPRGPGRIDQSEGGGSPKTKVVGEDGR